MPRIESIEVHPTRLPLAHEFVISRGSVGSVAEGAPHFFIKATDDEGLYGWGEARPSRRWSYETPESVFTTIERYLAPAIKGLDPADLAAVHRIMAREIAPGLTHGQPVAKSGLDMALHDLNCRRLRVPLSKHLGGARLKRIRCSYLVSAKSPAEASHAAATARDRGYQGFKVKIGFGLARDLGIIGAVHEIVPQAFIWADANQAYGLEEARKLAAECANMGVDVLEQPLPANDALGAAELVKRSEVPIAADESAFSPRDVEQLVRLKALDVLVIKVSKSAGLWFAREAMQIAQDAGIALLGSGLTESRLGLAASAHLFSAFGMDTPVDLNGPQFLADDVMPGNIADVGPSFRLPTSPGIGLEPDEDKLRQYEVKM